MAIERIDDVEQLEDESQIETVSRVKSVSICCDDKSTRKKSVVFLRGKLHFLLIQWSSF